MSISQNFPSSRPSLNLNFARSKKLDPRITFTRTSTATFVDEDGLVKRVGDNVPRFEHTPSTGESLGLLIEDSRTNLTTFSEQLDNARWTVSNFTLSANTTDTTAPDGNNNAEKILETVTNGAHAFVSFNAYSISAGTVYTSSIFVKSINKQFVQLVFDDTATTNGGYVNFDLTSGTITASANYGNGSNISGSITSYPNSWYRISITTTAGTSATLARFAVNGLTSGSSGVFPGYAGNTSNGYYIWGAQVEAGAFATSYIPTVASTVTRSADNASITGTNFSGFYNPDEGSVCAKFKFYENHGSYCEAVSIAGSGAGFMVNDIAGGLVTDCYSANTVVTGGNNARNTFVTGVRAYKFSTNESVIGCSGASSITTQTGTKVNPNPTVMWMGRRGSGSTAFGAMNGYIQSILYYPVRLPNTQLQNLTK